MLLGICGKNVGGSEGRFFGEGLKAGARNVGKNAGSSDGISKSPCGLSSHRGSILTSSRPVAHQLESDIEIEGLYESFREAHSLFRQTLKASYRMKRKEGLTDPSLARHDDPQPQI